jgi:purine-nucleoside phosphorylase
MRLESIKASKKGDLILLDDHINLQPLSGLNSFEYGGIFPDMSAPYNARLNSILMEQSKLRRKS